MTADTPASTWWTDLVALTLIIGTLFFLFLGARPLSVPDGARYSEIPREMVASGDYVTPRLNSIKYFEKPILFYWLQAAAIKTFGLSLWSLRFVNALLGLFGCLLIYIVGRRLFDRGTGILASTILATSSLYFAMLHIVSLDLSLSVFLTASLTTFLLGVQHPPGTARRNLIWLAFAFAALAVLTKGLVGIVFPCLIVGAWLCIFNEWRLLKSLYLPSALLIFFIIVLPWHVLVQLRNPEFFQFYFIDQQFLRYATLNAGRYQPAWFFIPILIAGFFPWIVFLGQTIKFNLPRTWQERSQYKKEIFLLLWAGIIFAFFSFSKSKLIPYILPVLPPLALLTGRYLKSALTEKKPGVQWGLMLLSFSALLVAVVLCLATHFHQFADPLVLQKHFYFAAAIILFGSVSAWLVNRNNTKKAFLILFMTTAVFLLIMLSSEPYLDPRSIQPLTTILKPLLKPEDEVISYHQYYQDLPVYLERRITVVNWHNELSFGMQLEDTSAWMIDDVAFWECWHGQQRVFTVLNKNDYHAILQKYPHEKIYLLGQTMENVLISNREVKS